MSSKVRYGIIGLGKMGSTHAKKLIKGRDKNGVLTAACDIAPDRLEWARKNLKEVPLYSDYKQLIASKDVDAIIVATPHYLHPVIGIEVLNGGKHLLSEKPVGVYTMAVKELIAVAKSKPKLVFGVMYNQRTNPLYRKAKDLIESGELGEIKRINWIITNWYRPQAYYDQGGWRGTWEGEGGGVLINQCPHQLDLFCWLGGMPKLVSAHCKIGVGRKISVENDVTFYTEYESGASGVFVTSTHDYPGTNRLEISGDGGKLVIEQNLLKEKLTFHKLSVKESEFNAINKKFMPFIPMRKHVKKTGWIKNSIVLGLIGQHTNIIRNFSLAVLGKATLIAPGEDGINGLSLSNAAYLSTWLNRPVELPIDEDEFFSELQKQIEKEKGK